MWASSEPPKYIPRYAEALTGSLGLRPKGKQSAEAMEVGGGPAASVALPQWQWL